MLRRMTASLLAQRCLEVAIEDIFSEDKVIDIPKRPKWDYRYVVFSFLIYAGRLLNYVPHCIRSMSKDEVEANEQKAFDEWVLAVHEKYGENVSHFEHNLEVCRGPQGSDTVRPLVDHILSAGCRHGDSCGACWRSLICMCDNEASRCVWRHESHNLPSWLGVHQHPVAFGHPASCAAFSPCAVPVRRGGDEQGPGVCAQQGMSWASVEHWKHAANLTHFSCGCRPIW